MVKRLFPAVIFLITIVAIAVIAAFFSQQNSNTKKTQRASELLSPYQLDQEVTAISVQDKNGKSLILDKSLPDKTLVTFWNSSCSECAIGLPLINTFAKNNPGIRTIYINTREDKAQADEALKNYKLDIETYYDPTGEAFQKWFGTMPVTYYITEGKFRFYFPGRVGSEHLQALLGY